MTQLEVDRQNIETRLNQLSTSDKQFNENVTTIFGMASKAYELFKSSEIEEKRRVLALLFPNLQMNGEKLVLEPRKPFDLFINQGDRLKWLPILYQMRKECHEEVLDLATHVQVIRRNFGLAA